MTYFKYNAEANIFTFRQGECAYLLPQIIWHITNACNLCCPFCFSVKNNDSFDFEKLQANLNLFEELGVQKIDISGGEPLLHENVGEICRKLHEKNIAITLTTSGGFDNRRFNFIIKDNHLFSRLIFSIDHPNSITHDSLRGQKGLFKKINFLIKSQAKINSKKIRINTVVTKLVLNHAKDFVQFIKDTSPYEWCLIQMHPANKLETFDKVKICKSEFRTFVNKIKATMLDSHVKVITRETKSYSDYWILEPNNSLYKHTQFSENVFVANFEKNNFLRIQESINSLGFKIPTQ